MSATAISGAALRQLVERGEAFVVDVREPAEFAGGHIPGAVSVPLARLRSADFAAALGRKLVLVCASGRRSESGCALVRDRIEGEILTLEGGLNAWRQAGGELAATGRAVLPLDRQVQIVVGLMVVVGLLLGLAAHQAFLLLPLFVGAGLVVAGVTGFCGMARLLAAAPWNQTAAAGRTPQAASR